MIPRRRWSNYPQSVMHSRHIRLLLLHLLGPSQLPLKGLSLDGNLRDEQEEYAENVFSSMPLRRYRMLRVRKLVVVRPQSKIFPLVSELTVRLHRGTWRGCLHSPAMDNEGDMDSVLDGNYGAKKFDHNERIHYCDLKDLYRQRRDRTRQLVAQLSTLNTRINLNPTEVRLLAKTLSKEDIQKYSKFETLATTICDQQDELEAMRRRYDEQVASSSAQLSHLTRSHEARMAHELSQAKVHVDVANERVQASEAKAQLLLHEQTQSSEMLISEWRQALRYRQFSGDGGAAAQRAPRDKASSYRARTSLVYAFRQS